MEDEFACCVYAPRLANTALLRSGKLRTLDVHRISKPSRQGVCRSGGDRGKKEGEAYPVDWAQPARMCFRPSAVSRAAHDAIARVGSSLVGVNLRSSTAIEATRSKT